MRSPILLRDVIEEKFESPAAKERVRAMQSEGQAVIDNESRELLAVHHTGFIVAEAGQFYRGYPLRVLGVRPVLSRPPGSGSGQRQGNEIIPLPLPVLVSIRLYAVTSVLSAGLRALGESFTSKP
jgi:hypothetical protein